MITTSVYQRTFYIKIGDKLGSAFTIDVDNRQYLISALHLFRGLKQIDEIEIYYKEKWNKVNVKVVGLGNLKTLGRDIIVFALNFQLSPQYLLNPTLGNFYIGQSAYFLGFPFGYYTKSNVNRGFPIPLVKRALVSGALPDKKTGREIDTLLLDGFCSSGFSGGPVITELPENNFNVIGIVNSSPIEELEIKVKGMKTDEFVALANSGILICTSIEIALELIESNSIGFKLSS